MIRAMDRFYTKHPRISFAIAIVAAAAAMLVSSDWDKSETAALRLQMWSSTGRGA